MADNSRIEELRRRVQKDPASIAFAQLAEEYRRAGRFEESIDACETGLTRHPGYLSARVTLGRSLIEVGQLDRAHAELSQVLRAAPENLAALRGLAEIHHRQGDLAKALDHYKAALELARHDPDLEQIVAEIGRELEPRRAAPAVSGGLTFEQVRDELFSASAVEAILPAVAAPASPDSEDTAEYAVLPAALGGASSPAADPQPLVPLDDEGATTGDPADRTESLAAAPSPDAHDLSVARAQFAELERWLDVLAPEPSVDRSTE